MPSPNTNPDIELDDLTKKRLLCNTRAELVVSAADAATISTIFAMFLKSSWHKALEESAKFFLFPAATLFTVMRGILALRQYLLDNGWNRSGWKAIVEIGAALSVSFAVVGALAFATVLGAFSPFIFAGTMGAKFLYHLREAYLSRSQPAASKAHMIAAGITALATAAVTVVMIFLKPIFAILGVIAGVIGTGVSLHKLYKTFDGGSPPGAGATGAAPANESLLPSTQSPSLSQGALLHRTLNQDAVSAENAVHSGTTASVARSAARSDDDRSHIRVTRNSSTFRYAAEDSQTDTVVRATSSVTPIVARVA